MCIRLFSVAMVCVLGLYGFAQPANDDAKVELLLTLLRTGNDDAKRQAVGDLAALGAKAKKAVPELERIITKLPGGDLEAHAIIALGKIGPDARTALPVLERRAESLYNGQREPVENACISIGQIGGWTPEATRRVLPLGMGHAAYFAANPETTLPQLVKLLTDNDIEVRRRAMDAARRFAELYDELLKKHPKTRAAFVDFARQNLDARDGRERRHAADLFRTIVPDEAEKIIPIVTRLLVDGVVDWRDADHLLGGSGDRRSVHENLRLKAQPSLIAAFAEASPQALSKLVEYLGSDIYRRHVDWLPAALGDKNAKIRSGAAATARAAEANPAIVKALRERLKDDDFAVRFHAAAALIVHDGKGPAEPLLAPLAEGLRQESHQMRYDAVSQIRQLGKLAEPATPALVKALDDPNIHVKTQAADILLSLDATHGEAKHGKQVAAMVQALLRKGGDNENISQALRIANKLGPNAAPLVPELVAVMESNSNWAGRAAEVLEKLGPDAKAAIPILQKSLQSANRFDVTQRAAKVALALAKLGAPDHALATRMLLPFVTRSGDSLLLTYYFPHYPNETVQELTKLLDEPKLHSNVLQTLSRMHTRDFMLKEAAGDPYKEVTKAVRDNLKTALIKLLDCKDLATKTAAATTMKQLKLEAPTEKLTVILRECIASDQNYIHPMTLILEGQEETLVPAFIEAAAQRDDPTRSYFSVFASADPRAIPILARIAEKESPRQCVHAAWALAGLGYNKMKEKTRADVMAILLTRLRDLRNPERGDVAMAILSLSPKSRPREAVIAVGEYLVDKDAKYPANAVSALRRLEKDAAPAAKHLRDALSHASAYVRLEAASCLGVIDAKKFAADILPVVQKEIGEKTDEAPKGGNPHLNMALHLCVLLGPDARPALPRLLEINAERRDYSAILAGQAAVAIDKSAIPKVAKNLALLLSGGARHNREEQMAVHRLLREMGKPARDLDVHLVPLLRLEDENWRNTAAVTLILLDGPNADKGVEHFRRTLRSSDEGCIDALQELDLLKGKAQLFLPELRKLLDSPDDYERTETLRAIGSIGPDAKELLPELNRRLENAQSESMRRDLNKAIRKITQRTSDK